MKRFSATANIIASPDTIWEIITDAKHYPDWDPGIVRIEGTIARGEKIKAISKLNPKKAFPVTVTDFDPGYRMTWTGGMVFNLFKGERTFSLTENGPGSTDFTISEEFSGPLLPLFEKNIPDMNKPFREFVDGLKEWAEGGHRRKKSRR